MQTIRDFVKLVESGAQPVVEFGKKIEDDEYYADAGMRARALRVEWRDKDFVVITVSYAEFEAHNSAFEQTGYRDKNGGTSFTARQAGKYEPEENLYFNPDQELAGLLTPLAAANVALFQEYQDSDAARAGQPYVSWLEDAVLTNIRASRL